MKKFTLILATVALLAAGCSKTEVVGPQNRKGINFAAYTAKTTKAAQEDVTTENLENFEVTAFGNGALYFDDVTFKKNRVSTVWESTTKYFWPAFPLTFCAYNTPSGYDTPVQPTGFTRNINTTRQTLEVAPAAELAYQEDLVAAYAAGKKESDATSTGNSLSLTFNHYLTQVIVKAKNARSDIYKVEVDSVKIANMAGHGTYTFSTNIMEAPEDIINGEYSIDYKAGFPAKTLTSVAQAVMPNTNNGNGRWYLIPQSVTSWDPETNRTNTNHGTYLALKVKITANNGARKIYPATGENSGWMAVPIPSELAFAQGKKYIVTINFFAKNGAGYVDPEKGSDLDGNGAADDKGKKIICGEIKFDATVNNWAEIEVGIDL